MTVPVYLVYPMVYQPTHDNDPRFKWLGPTQPDQNYNLSVIRDQIANLPDGSVAVMLYNKDVYTAMQDRVTVVAPHTLLYFQYQARARAAKVASGYDWPMHLAASWERDLGYIAAQKAPIVVLTDPQQTFSNAVPR